MSVIEVKGHPTPLSKYDLWAVPDYQDTVLTDIETEHRPLATLDSKSTIYFDVKSGYDEYIQLDDIWLHIVVQIVLEKPLKAEVSEKDWDSFSPTNSLLHSMFKQVDLIIGNRTITHSLQTYPYKCDIETKLGKGNEAKDSFLTAALWYEDYRDYSKINEPHSKRSSFFKPHKAYENKNFSHSNEVDLGGKLHIDMFEQEKPLPGNSTMRIKLIPNDPSFYLMMKSDIRLKAVLFKDATLYLHRAKISRPIVEAHNKAFGVGNAIYPIRRSHVVSNTINKGTMDAIVENVIIGQLPKRCFIMLVTHTSFNGSFTLNPFNYQHFNLNYLTCYLNGVQYPEKAFQPNFEKKLYMREFLSIFKTTNQTQTDSCIDIDRENYPNGNVIFGLNFAPDLSPGCCVTGYSNPIKRGSMRLHLKFSEALKETVNVLTYLDFDNVIEINEERNPVFDFN